MIIAMKIKNAASVLFTGKEEEQLEKSIVLLLKKDTRKKFFVTAKIILESE
jgi:hypothetical protein